jgi:hypothetical protein
MNGGRKAAVFLFTMTPNDTPSGGSREADIGARSARSISTNKEASVPIQLVIKGAARSNQHGDVANHKS